MELDDLKNTWNDANSQEQPGFTTKMIDLVTQKNYATRVHRIIYPEVIGALVCLFAALYIVLNFFRLDTTFLIAVGAFSIVLLCAIAAIGVLSLTRIYKKPDLNKTYAESLKELAVQTLQFHKLQKVNVSMCYLLLVCVVVLLSKIVNGVDLSTNKYYWTFSFTIGYIFLMFYSRWVSRHYQKSLQQAKDLLQEL
jgi:hypothetical protein